MHKYELYAYLYGKKESVNKFLKEGVKGKDINIRVQELDKHIDFAFSFLNKELKKSKLWKYYIKTFHEYEKFKEYKEEVIDKWIGLIITFHDIGKIFYQRNFGTFYDVKYLNFKGHEFLSVYLVDKFLGIWLEEDIENRIEEYKNFKWLTYASILYHHHAMGLKRREKVNKINVCENKEHYRIILNKTSKILNKYLKNNFNTVNLKNNFIKELEIINLSKIKVKNRYIYILSKETILDIFRYIEDLNTKIWEYFVRDKNLRKLMILTMSILLITDYMSSKDREGTRSTFSKVLEDYVRIYKHLFSN